MGSAILDWQVVISSNRDRLLGVLAGLLAMAGLAGGTLPRHVRNAILAVLRPAEAAVRRLIFIAARGLVLKARPSRPIPVGLPAAAGQGADRLPVFGLIAPLKRFLPWDADEADEPSGPPPRISLPGVFDPVFAAPLPAASADDEVSAASIRQRLAALQRALDALPHQARRLARWRARHCFALKVGGPFKPIRQSPFRPGLPPGYRKHQLHPVDAILGDCHYFALEAIAADTT